MPRLGSRGCVWAALGPPGLCAVTLLVVVASMPLDLGYFLNRL